MPTNNQTFSLEHFLQYVTVFPFKPLLSKGHLHNWNASFFLKLMYVVICGFVRLALCCFECSVHQEDITELMNTQDQASLQMNYKYIHGRLFIIRTNQEKWDYISIIIGN